MATRPKRVLRSDATANRTALLDAATRLLLHHDPPLTLGAVAREAGVGIATLYRNFPSRHALLVAVSARSYQLVSALAEEAAQSREPPLDALSRFFGCIISHREDLALPLLGVPSDQAPATHPLGLEISRRLEEILQRGKDDGTIRTDVNATDIIIAGAALAHAQLPAPAWDKAAKRLARLILDGLHAHHTPPLPSGLDRAALDDAPWSV